MEVSSHEKKTFATPVPFLFKKGCTARNTQIRKIEGCKTNIQIQRENRSSGRRRRRGSQIPVAADEPGGTPHLHAGASSLTRAETRRAVGC